MASNLASSADRSGATVVSPAASSRGIIVCPATEEATAVPGESARKAEAAGVASAGFAGFTRSPGCRGETYVTSRAQSPILPEKHRFDGVRRRDWRRVVVR